MNDAQDLKIIQFILLSCPKYFWFRLVRVKDAKGIMKTALINLCLASLIFLVFSASVKYLHGKEFDGRPTALSSQATTTHSTTGDLNLDGFVNILDRFLLADFLSESEARLPSETGDADLNGDGLVNILDLQALKQLIYSAGRIYVDATATGPEDGSAERPFNTILEAVAVAQDGDVITLAAGDYVEKSDITLPLPVTIEGAGDGVTSVSGMFYVAAPEGNMPVIIAGLTCTAVDFDDSVTVSAPIIVLRSTVEYIYVWFPPTFFYTIEDSFIESNVRFAQGSGSAIIVVRNCRINEDISLVMGMGATVIIADNTIGGDISDLSGACWTTISGNTLTHGNISDKSGGFGSGIEDQFIEYNCLLGGALDIKASSATIRSNTIYSPEGLQGIICASGSPTNITDNKIIGGGITTSAGQGVVCNNTISDAEVGIQNSSGATLMAGNVIHHSDIGVITVGPAHLLNNIIYGNTGDGIVVGANDHGPLTGNTVINNGGAGIRLTWAPVDLGGGADYGMGGNVIQGNAGHDLVIESPVAEAAVIYARYNTWDHDTEAEIDALDIYDGKDDPAVGTVDFLPIHSKSVSYHHLRFQFSTTSDWAVVECVFGDALLGAQHVEVTGDPLDAGGEGGRMWLFQSLENAQAGHNVSIVVDYAVMPGTAFSPLPLAFQKGDIGDSALTVTRIHPGGSEYLSEIHHQGSIPDDPCNWMYTVLDLSSLAEMFPVKGKLGDYEPLLWAFYYPWYGSLTDWFSPYLSDRPAILYTSHNQHDIDRHIEEARGAGIDGFISSWWGPGGYTDDNLRLLLDLAAARDFKVSVIFETLDDTSSGRDPEEITQWLTYLLTEYSDHPAFMKIDGKPVVVVWASESVLLEDWETIFTDLRTGGLDAFYIGMGLYGVHQLSVFDGLHEYALVAYENPASDMAEAGRLTRHYHLLSENETPRLWAATTTPGYDDHLLPDRVPGLIVPRQDGQYYRDMWAAALASEPGWMFITSWNEWWEHTHIEPSILYGAQYLVITEEVAAQWKTGD